AGKLPDLENADYVQSIHTDQRYIYSMGADREGFIWISSLKHLFRYDPATEQFRRYFYPGPGVYIFYADFGAQILLGCIGKGNFFLDKQTGKWQPAPNWNLDLLSPPIHIPEENTLWGITDTGLMKINTQTFDTRYIRLYDDAREQRCIVAHGGWLWIGTARGLEKVNPQTFSHVNFDRSKGLPGNYVYSMVADGNYLWLGTGEGLCRFHVETNEVKNFYVEDGLSHNEFNTLSTLKMDDGRILMGGLNGINAFYPSDLEGKTTAKSRTLLSRYSLFDTEADSLFFFIPSKSETSIVLPASVTSLNLYLALSSYLDPAENQYVWRMDGFDEDWYYAGNQHVAMYRHIPPGTYTFRAKAADPFGNWSGNEISLRIIVLRPWYSRWWAWLLYALLTGWAVLSLYRNQLSKKMEHAENLRLQELDGFKNRFFTNITHEFRTPLTVILGLSEYVESKVTPDLKSTVGLIRRNGHNLLRLINQILDLAKLESDTLKINYVQGNVLPYLRYIAESLQSMAQTQNVLLQVESSESEIIMDYDPERLLQIMYNLLSNAIKFTPGGGRVILEIMVEKPDLTALDWKAAHKSPHLICKVTDTGVGILPDDLAKVFDRFYQASNLEKAKTGGTGIGLSLTRELVKSMKGDISVQSEVGKGSVFTVRLPILNNSDTQATGNEKIDLPYSYDALKGEAAAFASDNGSAAHLSILLIEDNPDVVAYLHTCLGEDYHLEYAYNGRAGIEKALETVPDLIVSDVMMPEKDGFEVCETLKNDERTSHIPIVLLTAKADVESRIAGLRRGADAYLAKPFHREELLATLKNLIELRQKLQAQYMSDNLSGTSLSAGNRANQTGVDADPENEFLLKLRAIVDAHISDSSLDVDTLCRKIGMGRTNLHNKLSALTGLSTTLYVRKIRLYRSKELLLDTQMNVSEVAYAVGFNDPRFFARVFSEEFGMSPSALKKG
ncbi:MAG: response regulator, partial [Saprospiraceae bacterium]|nr:response regulator [Saprospiraceae bacterium]